MTSIPPPVDHHELHRASEELAGMVARELTRVANLTARRVTAAATPVVASTYSALDALVVIGGEWEAVVAGRLVPMAEQLYLGSSAAWTLAVRTGLPGWDTAVIPPVPNLMAEQYLAGASNRLRHIGDELWANTRSSLLEGFQAGEDMSQLAQRVRDAAGVTTPRAQTIARTEVVSASNRGSRDTAEMLVDAGQQISKVWMSTPDSAVRETHAEADGQIVPFADSFEVGGAALEYPGDPNGPPEEVINCRCVIGYEFPDGATPPEDLAESLIAAGEDTTMPATASSNPSTQADNPPQAMPGQVLTAAANHDGGMIALVPTAEDAQRLALPDGEPAHELHVTLFYLGDAAELTAVPRRQLTDLVRAAVAGLPAVEGAAFGVSAFNPNAEDKDTALVLTLSGEALTTVHQAVVQAVAGYDEAAALPTQHSPWHAHMTLTYSDDLELLRGEMAERLGPITFDRVRLAFGGQYTDIDLSAQPAAEDPEGEGPDGEGPDGGDIEPEPAANLATASQPLATTTTAATPAAVGEVEPPRVTAQAEPNEDGECPPGEHLMPDGMCMPDEDMSRQRPEHFHALMITEGVSTGFRTFAVGALTWRTPPFSLRWQQQEPEHGGHALAVGVGNVERAERRGPEIHSWGRLDLDDPVALEFARKLVEGFVPWVSIGLDEQPAEIELIWPEDDEVEEPDNPIEALFVEPEQIIFHSGRIGELTAVTVPAQQEARIEALPALVEELRARGVYPEPMIAAAVPRSFGAVAPHDTATSDRPWDGAENETRLPSPMSEDTARAAYAWIDSSMVEDGEVRKNACKFIHHHVNADGRPGAANLSACRTGIGVLNGARGGTNIPEGDKRGVYNHLANHLRDAGEEPPPLMSTTEQGIDVVISAGHTITIPDVPPAWWFEEPLDVEVDGALTITDEGRIYGRLAPAGVAHRAYHNRKVYVPMGNVDYERWMNKHAIVDFGGGRTGRINAGVITGECGHCPPWATSDTAERMAHYDNSCSVFAKARVGEWRDGPNRGVWIAGALEPFVSAERVSRALGCDLSGDWGPHPQRSGWKELVATLLVPVAGFTQARGASVTVQEGAIVASAVPVRYTGPTEVTVQARSDTRPVLERLARVIGRDAASRMEAMRAKVHTNERGV